MKTVTFRNGVSVPALGMGSWNLGDSKANRADEVASLRAGLDSGLSVIDTAEMYGSGRSEQLVGEAIAGRRDEVFLISKVLPSHASRSGTRQSCQDSLRRLGTDRLDLYLLHWRGSVPLEETVDTLIALQQDGLIRQWGVSNFDTEDMEELDAIAGAETCAANQILYNLEERGAEFDLLARDRENDIVTIAYSPLGQGGDLLHDPVLAEIARDHETASGPATPAQIALAWTISRSNVLSIPKAGSLRHFRENRAALDIVLTSGDRDRLDARFGPPRHKTPLAMI
ncbi:aldo/keto reductase [Swaminathania salitolerans]|uniref:Oxidoreductase n=1 Tax=Swaminathania salitolerans TaxID=182838 RepID=A0A511BKS7_9PROT|nr:aldo/keto reductase [Swaminathania salitolerans]GBQ09471.1 aldo/keto reductase [Swaminathania salitolerans LMG 21291]GEL00960.1 oxidoreductase [Swaminathania salitolerans]